MREICFSKQEIDSADDVADGLVCASWEISPQLIYFEGHFPHFPVLPAVAIVDACLAFLNAASTTTSSFILQQVPSAKFLQPLAPGQKVRIHARPVSSNPETWDFEWTELKLNSPAAQVRLVVARK